MSVLAAALGVPTWQLSHGLDWQMLGRDAHPWFAALIRFTRAWGQPAADFLHDIAERLHDWQCNPQAR